MGGNSNNEFEVLVDAAELRRPLLEHKEEQRSVKSLTGQISVSTSRKLRVWACRARLRAAVKKPRLSMTRLESDSKALLQEIPVPQGNGWIHVTTEGLKELMDVLQAHADSCFLEEQTSHSSDGFHISEVQRQVQGKLAKFIRKFQYFFLFGFTFAAISAILYASVVPDPAYRATAAVAGLLISVPIGWTVESIFFAILRRTVRSFPAAITGQYFAEVLRYTLSILIIGLFVFLEELILLNSNLLDRSETYKNFWISFLVVWSAFVAFSIVVKAWNSFVFFQNYWSKIQKTLYKEALIRHLLRPNRSEFEPIKIENLTSDSFFHDFQYRSLYVLKCALHVPLQLIQSSAPKKNFLSWNYSEDSIVKITTEEEVRVLAQIMFFNIDKGYFGALNFVDWIKFFGSSQSASVAWKELLSTKQFLRGINEEEFCLAIRAVFRERLNLAASIEDFISLSSIVSKLLFAIFWVMMIFVVAILFGVRTQTVLVTFSSLLIASAVAFGNSMKTIIDSAVFILYSKPYDVGEKIALDNPEASPFQVMKIGLLTTTLKGLDARILIFPNVQMANKQIYNLSKSTGAIIHLTFEIDFKTNSSTLKKLRDRIFAFVEHNKNFTSRLDFYIKEVVQSTSKTLHIWVQCNLPWNEGFAINYCRSDFIDFVQNNMSSLRITYRRPPIPILVEAGELPGLTTPPLSRLSTIPSSG